MFEKGSRYENVDESELTDENDRVIRYKKTRFAPASTARFRHLVTEGERLDHMAHRYFRDAERFWRICDTNTAMWPDDLLAAAGEWILIPLSWES